jgi:putative nucleotidyltransferase with HDIG domain
MVRSRSRPDGGSPPAALRPEWREPVADSAERLMAPDSVVRRTLTLLDGPWAPDAVVACLRARPELAAHVMRAAAGHGGPPRDLPAAVALLGPDTLRGCLLAAAVYRLIEAPLPVYGLARYALLAHARSTAALARALARRALPERAAAAYLAGLMHDLGKPILASAGGEALLRALAAAGPRGAVAAERAAFGTDHGAIGAWVCASWGLDAELCRAIAEHHGAPEDPLGRLLRLADLLSRPGGGGDPDALAEAAALGLGAADLEAASRAEDAGPPPPGMTRRELAVLRALSAGCAPGEVALRLGIDSRTVDGDLRRVSRLLGVGGGPHAVLLAQCEGWA